MVGLGGGGGNFLRDHVTIHVPDPAKEREITRLVDVLTKIRDSTFRDAASLRAIADDALNRFKAGDFAKR